MTAESYRDHDARKHSKFSHENAAVIRVPAKRSLSACNTRQHQIEMIDLFVCNSNITWAGQASLKVASVSWIFERKTNGVEIVSKSDLGDDYDLWRVPNIFLGHN